MIINHEKWNQPVFISDEPTILLIKDLFELFSFQNNLINQVKGEEGFISIFTNDKAIKIDKEIEVITNIFELTLNNRKMVNFLHKEIVNQSIKSDDILIFEELKTSLSNRLKTLRQKILIDYTLDDDIEFVDILKLFDVKFTERTYKPGELLIKYLDVLTNMSKIRIAFIFFGTYFLTDTELEHLYEYCKVNKIKLILVEKELLKKDLRHISIIDGVVLI